MAKFKCKDIGMKCNFEVQTDNPEEMISIIKLHAEKSHNLKEVPQETLEKIQKAIKK